MVLLQVIDLSFVFKYLFVKLVLELSDLIMSIAHLLMHLLHSFSHPLNLALILAVLCMYLLIFYHHFAHLLPHLSILPLEVREVGEILQPAVLLLLNLPDQRLDVVPVLMFLLSVSLLLLVDAVLAVPLHTLDGLMSLDYVVGDGTVKVLGMDDGGAITILLMVLRLTSRVRGDKGVKV